MAIGEKYIRQKVIKKLALAGAFAVENAVHDGAPDVCTTFGWIEIKRCKLARYPTAPISIDLRSSQRIWLDRWHRFGGTALLLTVAESGEWFMHDGYWAAKNIGFVTLGSFRMNALKHWDREPGSAEFYAFMADIDSEERLRVPATRTSQSKNEET